MRGTIKSVLIPAALLLVFLLGVVVTRQFYVRSAKENSREESEVLLEKIRTVAKLVTVEGYFSEIYNYQDYYYYDLPFLRKKALLRVKAKVSVGYDLGQMKIDAYPDERLIVISHIPDPSIISIDHDLDYYDISEGTFNSFSEDDYDRINRNAKQFIEDKALQSDLMQRAEEQGNRILEVIEFMAVNSGWTVKYQSRGGSFEDLMN